MAIPIVKRYLIALELYKWVGVATVTVAVGVSGIVALQPAPEPKHTIAGILRYISPPLLFSDTGTQIQEQAKVVPPDLLLNNEVREKVAENILLEPRQLKKAQLKPARDGTLFVIYEDTDSEQSLKIVDALLEEIIKQSRNINTTYQRNIIEQVQKRLPPALEELKEVQKELETFKREEEALLITSRAEALPAAIAGSREQQRQIQLQLDGIKAQIASLEKQLGLNADQAYVSQALAADPIIASLRVQLYDVESQLDKLLLDFRDEYPPVVELRRQKEVVEKQLEQRAAEVLGGNGVAAPLKKVDQIRVDAALDPTRQQLAQALIGLETQKEQLEMQLETTIKIEKELQAEYATIPNKQFELAQFEQEIAIKKARVDKMLTLLEDAEAAEAEITSSLAVAQKAHIATKGESAEKNMPMMLAIGGLAGVVVGGGLIFVLGMLSGKFYTWQEIKTALQEKDVPLLGLLPDVMFLDSDLEEMPLLLEPHSPYLEFYEKLRTNLQRQSSQPVKVVLFSSAAKGEGKTFCAYNLAIAAARAGKRTLLIETDLRSPSKVKSLKIAPYGNSSVEPLRYYGDTNNCVRLVPEVENLYIVPSAGPINQAGGIIESSEMQRLLKDARYRFDFVVLDSPCVSQNNDAFILEPYTDGMIIVARPYYTVSGVLAQALDDLTEEDEEESTKSGPRLLGVVVNGADLPVELPSQQFEDLDISQVKISDSPRKSSIGAGVGVMTAANNNNRR